jgi:hypothetical protein
MRRYVPLPILQAQRRPRDSSRSFSSAAMPMRSISASISPSESANTLPDHALKSTPDVGLGRGIAIGDVRQRQVRGEADPLHRRFQP